MSKLIVQTIFTILGYKLVFLDRDNVKLIKFIKQSDTIIEQYEIDHH